MTYKPGQAELVFGMWSEFIRRSVHAGLKVSTCSSMMWHTHTQTNSFWPTIYY